MTEILHQYLVAASCPGTDPLGSLQWTLYWGPEVHLITVAPLCKNASEKPCSLIVEALRARHEDSGLTDSCKGTD